MTKQELIQLIKECIQETQLEEGVALYHAREKESGFEEIPKRGDGYAFSSGHTKHFYKEDRPDKFILDFDFSKTRIEDLIIFDNNPINSFHKEGIIINAFIPYRFKTVEEIDNDYFKSNTEISRVYWSRPKKISNLKTSLRRAIKNLKSTDDVILNSKNIEEIKQMVKNGVERFNQRHNISKFDLIIKAPSSAPLNDIILEEMSKYVIDGTPKVVTDLVFIKNQVKDIRINYKKWIKNKYKKPSEGESDSKRITNLKYLKRLRQNLKSMDQEFQIKNIYPADLRPYVKNLLKLNPKLSKSLYNDIMRLSQGTRKLQMKDDKIVKGKDVFHAVLGGSVLIIDDTVGAYRTLIETSIAADNYLKPKYIHSFALLSDWLKQ